MGAQVVLQDWVTISGTGSGDTVVQASSDWIDADQSSPSFYHATLRVPDTQTAPPFNDKLPIAELSVMAHGVGRDGTATELFAGSTLGHENPNVGRVLLSKDGGYSWWSHGVSGFPEVQGTPDSMKAKVKNWGAAEGSVYGLANALNSGGKPTNGIYAAVLGKGVFCLPPGKSHWLWSGDFHSEGTSFTNARVTKLVATPGKLFAAVVISGPPYTRESHAGASALDAAEDFAQINARNRRAGLYMLPVDNKGLPAASTWTQVTGMGADGGTFPQAWRSIRDIAVAPDSSSLAVAAVRVQFTMTYEDRAADEGSATPDLTHRVNVEGGIYTLDLAKNPYEVKLVTRHPQCMALTFWDKDLILGLSQYNRFDFSHTWAGTLPFNSPLPDVPPFYSGSKAKEAFVAADSAYCEFGEDGLYTYASKFTPGVYRLSESIGEWTVAESLIGPPLSDAPRFYLVLRRVGDYLHVGTMGGSYRLKL